jgi:hypothetical protein
LKPKYREIDVVLRAKGGVDLIHHGTPVGIAWEKLEEVKE